MQPAPSRLRAVRQKNSHMHVIDEWRSARFVGRAHAEAAVEVQRVGVIRHQCNQEFDHGHLLLRSPGVRRCIKQDPEHLRAKKRFAHEYTSSFGRAALSMRA